MSIPHGNGCVSYLKALSDETRWEIVRILSNTSSSLTLGEIAENLELSSYNASKHVRILNKAGLICVVRDGRFKRIGIAPEWRSTVNTASTPGTLDLGCCRFDFSRPGLKVEKS
ncbi:MAG: winged helix-turn-helix domain-containing protein [Verrucomicrobiales bacterium]